MRLAIWPVLLSLLWPQSFVAASPRSVALIVIPARGVSPRRTAASAEAVAAALSKRRWQVTGHAESASRLADQNAAKDADDASLQRFRELAAEGEQQLQALRLVAAATSLSRAVALMERAGPWVSAPRELAVVLFHLGVVLERRGEKQLASEAFDRASAVDPQYAPSPTEFPPEILDRFRHARGSLRHCELKLTSWPTKSTVRIDGRVAGITPLRLELARGKHFVLLQREGFLPRTQTVVACRERTAAIALRRPTPAPRELSIAANASLQRLRGQLGTALLLALQPVAKQRRMRLAICRSSGCLHAELPILSGGAPSSRRLLALLQPPAPKPFYRTWWFWTAVGAATAAAVVLPIALSSGDSSGGDVRYVVKGSAALASW